MDKSKIEIQIGTISFIGEGDPDWLSSQLDKILDKAEALLKLSPPSNGATTAANSNQQEPANFSNVSEIANKPLATFLKDRNAASKQVEKFLATAIWLEMKGQNGLTTSDITKALKESHQNRLSNPADCLNQNVSKGYCEKNGKEFFVTPEGKQALRM